MIRLLILAGTLLPTLAFAEQKSTGEEIFDAKCSQCHTFSMAQGMLEPMPFSKRTAHLVKFLKTHPPKLDEDEKELVVRALAAPEK